jgi:hypothetical protein
MRRLGRWLFAAARFCADCVAVVDSRHRGGSDLFISIFLQRVFHLQRFPPRREPHDDAGGYSIVHATVLSDCGSLMASAALAMVPTLILFLFIQKYMISGATAGAVKG